MLVNNQHHNYYGNYPSSYAVTEHNVLEIIQNNFRDADGRIQSVGPNAHVDVKMDKDFPRSRLPTSILCSSLIY